MKIEIVETL